MHDIPAVACSSELSADELEINYQAAARLQNELKEWQASLRQTIDLGQDLISDIQSESDYPEDYLNNVTDKVQLIRRQLAQMEEKVPETMRDLGYWWKKAQLYDNLKTLSTVLEQYEAKLSEETEASEMQACKENLTTHTESLSQLKSLATETLLHPGAVNDPGNSIKADIYRFVENFEALESKFSSDQNMVKQFAVMEDLAVMEEQLKKSSGDKNCALRDKIKKLKDYQDRVEAINLWMEEVNAFLIADDADDLANLETQVKDSDALVEDIETLKSKLEEVNQCGQSLICQPCSGEMHSKLSCEMQSLNDKWEEVTAIAKAQNARLKTSLEKCVKLVEIVDELKCFMSQLQKDLPEMSDPVKRPTELSQRTFKLLHFKDKIEKKRAVLQSLLAQTTKEESLVTKITEVDQQWKSVCEPVVESYHLMKIASTGMHMKKKLYYFLLTFLFLFFFLEYGQFKTLLAQESDWLERLEKKLKRPTHSAADAEEISEELNEIENFLHNHPEDRLRRIRELAENLTLKKILISPWMEDVQRLEERWSDLQKKAKNRISLLESSITEAQEWEYKLIAVQDWLTERDILLSSHLEHELTVDDLPDETQVA